MKVALKAARSCINSNELDVATKVLARAADYEEVLGKEDTSQANGNMTQDTHLVVDYFIMRVILVSQAKPYARSSIR